MYNKPSMHNSYGKLKKDDNFFDNLDSESSEDDIGLEITEYFPSGEERTHVCNVSSYLPYPNRKRLLCFSVIKGDACTYGDRCTFAHTLNEQIINIDKIYIYQIILDNNLMNFYSLTNPKTDDIYHQLLFYTHVCPKCISRVCMGGYNCKYGTHTPHLKICKNDLLTGECINKTIDIDVDEGIFEKITDIQKSEKYVGCINGHHLSSRNMVPYYTYVSKKEASNKTTYQSVRYIDINHINRLLRQGSWKNNNYNKDGSSDSTDDDFNEWFKEKCSSSSEDVVI
jgi:hypothetical protein